MFFCELTYWMSTLSLSLDKWNQQWLFRKRGHPKIKDKDKFVNLLILTKNLCEYHYFNLRISFFFFIIGNFLIQILNISLSLYGWMAVCLSHTYLWKKVTKKVVQERPCINSCMFKKKRRKNHDNQLEEYILWGRLLSFRDFFGWKWGILINYSLTTYLLCFFVF